MRTQIGMSATTIIIGKTLYKIKIKIKNQIVILHPRKGWTDQQNILLYPERRTTCKTTLHVSWDGSSIRKTL